MTRMITQQTILKRGWSKNMINTLLPEPIYKDNPSYRQGAPMKLWDISTVESIEATEDYRILKEKYDKRKHSASKAVATKEANLRKKIDERILLIKVKKIHYHQVRKNTLDAKQARYNCFMNEDNYISDENLDCLERWMVNYIRHELTNYDQELYEMSGKVGCHKEYYRYKRAVLDAIGITYPELKEECDRQKERSQFEQGLFETYNNQRY